MSRPVRHRDLTDPRELRAIAHPLRIRILEELFLAESLTASELAERVGESPANCSWHLRQLAKYGYVEEAGGAAGRRRPWRSVVESRSWGDRQHGEAAAAGEAVTSVVSQHEFDEWRGYEQRKDAEPNDWYDAAFWSQWLSWMTAAELAEVNDTLHKLIMRHSDRLTDPTVRPADARPVRLVAWGFPARGPSSGNEEPA